MPTIRRQATYGKTPFELIRDADLALLQRTLPKNVRKFLLTGVASADGFVERHALRCSHEEFKDHIEDLFEPGMNWLNSHLWEIGYKSSPKSCKTDEQYMYKHHFRNLKPVWRKPRTRSRTGQFS